jgi:DNA polymerase III delta prime subunit
MTDLVVSVRLTAQDGGLVGQIRATEAQIEGLAKAEQQAANAAATLRDQTGRAASAIGQAGAAADSMAGASRAAAAAATGLAAAQGRVGDAGKAAVATAGQQRAAYAQLGLQVQDVFAQLSTGTSVFAILAQQGGQVAGALTGLGGVVGSVATFLSGPLGAALLGSVSVAGLLATTLFKTADAAKSLQREQIALASIVDQTTGQLRRQISVVQALALADQRAATFARQRADFSQRRSALIAAGLEAGQQRTAGGERGFGIAIPGQASASAREVAKLAAAYSQGAINAEQLSRQVDRIAAGDPKVQGLATRIRQLAASTIESARAAEGTRLEIAQIAVAAGSATAAQKRLVEARREQEPVNVSLIEAEAALAASTDRVSRAREQLRIVELRGRDAAKAGGAAADEYRANLLEARREVNAAEADETRAAQARRITTTATRQAAQAQRELETSLVGLERRFDRVAAANREYSETLAEIARLSAAGSINRDDASRFRLEAGVRNAEQVNEARAQDLRDRLGDAGRAIVDGAEKPLVDLAEGVTARMEQAGRAGGEAFRDAGIDAAQAISQVFGGRLGRSVSALLGLLQGQNTGSFTSVGGRAGGLLQLINGGAPAAGRAPRNQNDTIDALGEEFARSTAKVFDKGGFGAGVDETLGGFTRDIKSIFGETGLFSGALGKTLGKAFGGATIGSQIGKPITSALGIKGSNTGAQLGGAVGAFLPIPGGEIIGSILGSALGGALKPTRRASATIGLGADGLEVSSVTGNSQQRRVASSAAADSVIGSLQRIAEQFGGSITGTPSVSIGVRDNSFRVDPTGRGITKTRRGAVDFGEDQAGAIAFATADAIKDGVITGISPAVAKALQSSSDLDKAVREALKVDEIEVLLGGIDAAVNRTFRDLERQIAERNRIAAKYGFDLVKLEERNAKDRQDALERVLADRVGSLQTLLRDLTSGDLAEGTLADRRTRLLADIATAEADAAAGRDGAAQQVAELRRRLIEVSREAFGTAGGEFAADLSSSRASAQRIIDAENRRVREQADLARAANDKLDRANGLANEGNELLIEISGQLGQMVDQLAVLPGLVSGGFERSTGRQVQL